MQYDVSELYDNYEEIIEEIEQYDADGAIMNDIAQFVDIDTSKEVSHNYGNDTLLQIYFTEVGKIYEENNNEFDIEWCPENREKIIQMNMKTVISIAKRFIGCGMPFEDLIGVGNVGLCVAYNHYNPNKHDTKSDFMNDINTVAGDEVRLEELRTIFAKYYTYGHIVDKFNKVFTDRCAAYSKKEIEDFANKNIKVAKFNSVASMWILAYITNALNTQSRLIRRPISVIQMEKSGECKPQQIVNIDAPIGDGKKSTLQDVIPDKSTDVKMTQNEDQRQITSTIQFLMDGLHMREKRIMCYRYGIGVPRAMTPREIAARENISVARVQQIINNGLTYMRKRYAENEDTIDIKAVWSCFDN